jgi:alkylation response protein AidB-like acyl-CoA dehydrogenase
MDLDFTDEQDMLRDLVRGLCDSACSLETVRSLEDDPVGYSTDLWSQLAAADLIGLTLPERVGGSGMSALEAAVVYEELGRGVAPSPLFVSSGIAAGVLLKAGTPEQQEACLPGIANGSKIVSVAWLEPKGGFGSKGIRATATATADGDGFVLDGTKWHVPFASSATGLLVPARVGGADGPIDLFLVDPNAAGVTLTQMFSIGSDTQYEVELAGVRVAPYERIGEAGAGWDAFEASLLEGLVLLAAQAVGGAQYALDITVQYAKDREQFDKPLGAFQAISHYLADAATAVNGARTLVYEAAWALSEGHSIERLAPMAKLFACQTFRDVTAMGEQVFGGVGFTLEYDIQLYFRRAKQLQISWYDDAYLSELIAVQVLDQPA